MKVLVFTSLYPNSMQPNFSIFVHQRMRAFARRDGNDIRVVAPIPWFPLPLGSYADYAKIARSHHRDHIEIWHPRYPHLPKIAMPLHGILIMIGSLYRVWKIKRRFDFDLIDAHYVYPDGLAAVLLGKIFRVPVVVSARGSDINQFMHFPSIRPMLRYTLRHAERAIAVCGALKAAMLKLGTPAAKMKVIANGVDTGRFFPVDRLTARQKLSLGKARMVLSVGGLIPRKGFHFLIPAFRILADKLPDVPLTLKIIGEGPYRDALQAAIKAHGLQEHVQLVGSVTHDALKDWYSAADVFCLASSREGWANVLGEALACGTPVVATNIWGTPEIVSSSEVGLLVEQSAESIARGLQRALTREWDRSVLVNHVSRRTWQVVAQEVEEVFADVLGGSKAALVPVQPKLEVADG